MKPEFEKYTVEQLLEVKETIDKIQYPDRYIEVRRLLKQREKKITSDDSGIVKSTKDLFTTKDIYEYFRSGIFKRLVCIVASIYLYYFLNQLDTNNIHIFKSVIVLIMSVVGIFFPWDSDDNES